MPPELIWGQGAQFNQRLVNEIRNEPTSLQFVIYRLTVDSITGGNRERDLRTDEPCARPRLTAAGRGAAAHGVDRPSVTRSKYRREGDERGDDRRGDHHERERGATEGDLVESGNVSRREREQKAVAPVAHQQPARAAKQGEEQCFGDPAPGQLVPPGT